MNLNQSRLHHTSVSALDDRVKARKCSFDNYNELWYDLRCIKGGGYESHAWGGGGITPSYHMGFVGICGSKGYMFSEPYWSEIG